MTEDQIAAEQAAFMQEVRSKREAAYEEGFDAGAKEAYAEGRRDEREECMGALDERGRYWVENRGRIIDAVTAAGFRIMSNADRCWLQPLLKEQTIRYTKLSEKLVYFQGHYGPPKSLAEYRVGPCDCDPHVEFCDQCAPFMYPKKAALAAPPAQPAEPVQRLSDAAILDAFCRTPGIHQHVQAFMAGVKFAEKHHHAAIESAIQPQWLPIESAPKDFVTVFDGWNGERVPNISWGQPDYSPKGVFDWCVEEYEQNNGLVNVAVKGLTHWMPLPGAPKGTT